VVDIRVVRDGLELASTSVLPIPDAGGFFYLVDLQWRGYSDHFQVGDVVWVTQASASLSMTVPVLNSLADSETDRVFGQAPADAPLTVYLFPFASPSASYTQTVIANGGGNYELTWSPALDVRPADNGYVLYAQDMTRQVYTRFVAPLLRVQVGGTEASGYAPPWSSVVISVTHAGGGPLTWLYGYAGADGSFDTGCYFFYGEYPSFLPGDRIAAAAAGQTFSMTVASLSAQADLSHGQVRGEASTGQEVKILRFNGPIGSSCDSLFSQPPASQVAVTSAASGQYTASVPLTFADYGAAVVSSPAGYQTYARFAVPYLWARLGDIHDYYWVKETMFWGQVDDQSVPITVTIQGPSGYLKDQYRISASSNGTFFGDSPYTGLSLDSGDVITLTTPRGPQISLLLPLLTANADPASGIISGQAPPGERLTVNIWDGYYPKPLLLGLGGGGGGDQIQYTLVVTATAQGNYQADFSGLGGFTYSAMGEVTLTTLQGHTVVRPFRAQPLCPPYIVDVQVGGNLVGVQGSYGCPSAVLRLRSAQGQIKYESQINVVQYEQLVLRDYNWSPIPILPGDSIEIESGSHRNITQVPVLTVTLDPQTDLISGHAPPGTQLGLWVYGRDWYQLALTTTVNNQGTYAVSLAGRHTLVRGDRVTVNMGYLPSFYAKEVVPLVVAGLYDPHVEGWISPLSHYTVTLQRSQTDVSNNGYAYADGSFTSYLEMLAPGDTIVVNAPTEVIRMTLPFLSARVDRGSASVSGQAPPYASLEVELDTYYRRVSQVVTATAAGVYLADFPSLAPLQTAQGKLTHFNAEGNRTTLDFATPHWEVTLDSHCLNGVAATAGAPYTLTLQSADGTFSQVITGTSASGTGSFYTCFRRAAQPGDQLTLEEVSGSNTFTVPYLTAAYDYGRRVVEGQAPPGTLILAKIPVYMYWNGFVYRHVRTDASGHYGVDTSDLDPLLDYWGEVSITDEAGNVVTRPFAIQSYRCYLPVMHN
jgi:hypothetical protein